MKEKIKILMNGASGKMGRAVGGGLSQLPDMQLVAAVDVKGAGMDMGLLCGGEPSGILIQPDLNDALAASRPQVMVDFTNPQAVMKNIYAALSHHVAAVVGTTGFSEADFQQVQAWCEEFQTPVFVAANFAIGAVLLMGFAKEAAKYMPDVEVIELHHDQKLDAPSGTAVTTLEMMGQVRTPHTQGNPQEFERLSGSRGGDYQGMRVHSVRLPGYVASQEVLCGGLGQVLTIRHDALSRECYVPGVAMAVRKILTLKGLTTGLENIM